MNIEIRITADSAEEMQEALTKLGRPTTAVTVVANRALTQGGELTIPAGADLKAVAAAQMPEPEKRTRRAAAKAPKTTQEPTGEPEAQRAAKTPTEPEATAEAPQSAPELGGAQYAEPTPTIDQIAAAGARLLDDDADKMTALLDLLGKYGVQAITQLKPEQLAGFAADLRALGAEV